MPKDKFIPPIPQNIIVGKTYDEKYLNEYLHLLNNAMSFFIPHHDYIAHKQEHAKEFRRFSENNAFEAFWIDDRLIGLYWLEGIEVDTIAISNSHQRKGYGQLILSYALQRVFETSNTNYAVLYCVGWNHHAQTFYQKYGMELHTQHYIKYASEN